MSSKTKSTNLKLVEADTDREERKRLSDAFEKAENEWRIGASEARDRVRNLRAELERYREQLEGVPFDIADGESGEESLDRYERKYPAQLAEEINPLIGGLFRAIDAFAEKHGTHEFLDFNAKLFELKCQTAETGFQIGVLAGVIFAGSPKEVIDRFERGLGFSLECHREIVRKD
jgi:hypothetical protein